MPDESGQVNADHPSYPLDAEWIGRLIRGGSTVYFAHVAKITRLGVYIAPFSSIAAPGTISPGTDGSYYLVAVEGHGAYPFRIEPGIEWSPSYVASKLNLEPADAEALTEFFALIAETLVGVRP